MYNNIIHWMIIVCVALCENWINIRTLDVGWIGFRWLFACMFHNVLNIIIGCRLFHFNELVDIDLNLCRMGNILPQNYIISIPKSWAKKWNKYGFVDVQIATYSNCFSSRIRFNLPIGILNSMELLCEKKDLTLTFISHIEFT